MQIKQFLKKNLRWIILFICLILFLDIAEDVLEKEIMQKDIIGYNLISKYLISDFATPIAKIITQLGSSLFLIFLAIILFIAIKDRKIGICIWINLGVSALLNQILKHIVQRPRPTEFRIINETGYSFPSGHSMVSAAFYGFLIYLIYKKVKNKYIKWTLISTLSIIVLLIGISRIYLGVHYTSDVLGGFLISISYLVIYISAVNKFLIEK